MSDANVLLTTVTFTAPADPAAVLELDLELSTLGYNKRFPHVRPSTTPWCSAMSGSGPGPGTGGSGAVVSCSRRYNPPNTSGFVSPWTAIANRVVPGGAWACGRTGSDI